MLKLPVYISEDLQMPTWPIKFKSHKEQRVTLGVYTHLGSNPPQCQMEHNQLLEKERR